RIACDLRRSVSAIYNRALGMGLRKSAEYLASPDAHRIDPNNPACRVHRFPKGNVPFNKGKHHKPSGSERGWFKAGALNGAAAQKELPVGAERVQDGVLLRKVGKGRSRWARWQ